MALELAAIARWCGGVHGAAGRKVLAAIVHLLSTNKYHSAVDAQTVRAVGWRVSRGLLGKRCTIPIERGLPDSIGFLGLPPRRANASSESKTAGYDRLSASVQRPNFLHTPDFMLKSTTH